MSGPGGVNDSHPLNTTETGAECKLQWGPHRPIKGLVILMAAVKLVIKNKNRNKSIYKLSMEHHEEIMGLM